VTLPVQLRELADLVKDLEESDIDVEVQGAGLDGVAVGGDLFRANLTVLAPIEAETEADQEATVNEEPERDEADDLVASDEADAEEDEGEDASPLNEESCDVDGEEQDENNTSEPAADDDVDEFTGLDHTDPDDLQVAFDEYDTISDAAEAFPEVTYATVRQRMIEHGIYTPESYDTGQDDATEADETETAEADDVGADRVDEDIQDEPVAEPEPEPDDPQAQLGVDDPAAVESFHNLDTPDWLDEASFYQAVDMADNVEKLGEVLGWEEYDRLKRMVELLGVDERLDECLADRRNMEA